MKTRQTAAMLRLNIRLFCAILLSLASLTSFAQRNEAFPGGIQWSNMDGILMKGVSRTDYTNDTLKQFFNFLWNKCGKEGAHYYALAYSFNGGWVCENYNVAEGKIIHYNSYANPELTKLDGVCYSFYYNGNVQTSGAYQANMKTGPWMNYYENGQLMDSVIYERGIPTGVRLRFYPSGKLSERSELNVAGAGTMTGYYENGKTRQTGSYDTFNLESGVWTGFYAGGQIASSDSFHLGNRISGICFNIDGSTKDSCIHDRPAAFPGDVFDYVRAKVVWPGNSTFMNQDAATVAVAFMIDCNGMISNIRVKRHVSRQFDDALIRVVKKMPQWQPEYRNGVPVNSEYVLPLTFINPARY